MREKRKLKKMREKKIEYQRMGINMGDQKTAVCIEDISVEVEVEVNIDN